MRFRLHRKVKEDQPKVEVVRPTKPDLPPTPASRRCPACKFPVDTTLFKTKAEWEEYKISGLCRDCQEGIYGSAFNETSSPRGPEKI